MTQVQVRIYLRTCHMQFLCQMFPSYHFHVYKIWHRLELSFFSNDLELAQPTLGQLYATSSGHQQSLYETATSNVFP